MFRIGHCCRLKIEPNLWFIFVLILVHIFATQISFNSFARFLAVAFLIRNSTVPYFKSSPHSSWLGADFQITSDNPRCDAAVRFVHQSFQGSMNALIILCSSATQSSTPSFFGQQWKFLIIYLGLGDISEKNFMAHFTAQIKKCTIEVYVYFYINIPGNKNRKKVLFQRKNLAMIFYIFALM